MAQRIIYNNDSSGFSVVSPTPEWLESHTLEELAAIVVPPLKTVVNTGIYEADPETGQDLEVLQLQTSPRPYQIVDESEIPPDPIPPPPPDWVSFRRDLLASEVYTTIKLANFTPTTYHLPGELSAALVVDPPSCPIVCGLWNQLIRPLTNGQIEWLRTAIAAHHIPLEIDNNGVLTHADI